MKYAWCLVVVVLLAACDMKTPAEKKKEADEAARKAADSQAPTVRPEPPEEAHVLVKADAEFVSEIKRPAVGMVKVERAGVITCMVMKFQGPNVNRTIIGAGTTGGCCTTNDPPEKQAMGGTFSMVRDAVCTVNSPPCDEPVIVDGDYKAPWLHVRKILEVMDKGHAHMTRLVFATSTQQDSLKGVVAKLPDGWTVTDDLPATAKRIEIAAKGKELSITIDGTVYKDVASAVAALQKAGVKEVGLHPADPKTPLWAIVRGVEVSNSIAPAGPVRFVMLDK
ncbi:MAG: hypothetical protein K8T20_16815 [Planctomycetes bacterium]|nr:hypothetical protein [Planctomycetota bacterium]